MRHYRKRIQRHWRAAAVVILFNILPGLGWTQVREIAADMPATFEEEVERIERLTARWNFTEALASASALNGRARTDRERARALLLMAQAYGVQGIEYRDPAARYEGERRLTQAFALDRSLKDELGVAWLRANLATFRVPRSVAQRRLTEAENEVLANDKNAQAHFYLGLLHHFLAVSPEYAYTQTEQERERQLSIESLSESVKINPRSYEYWTYTITALFNAGRVEEARQATQTMMRQADLSPHRIPANASHPHVLAAAFLYGAEAPSYIRDMAQRYPGDVDLQLEAIQTQANENTDRYRQELESLVANIQEGRLTPPARRARVEMRALYRLAAHYSQHGRSRDALKAYDRIVELSPGYAEARYNRGVLFKSMAPGAQTLEERMVLLRKAERELEAQLALNWHDRYAQVREALDATKAQIEDCERELRQFEAQQRQEAAPPTPQPDSAVSISTETTPGGARPSRQTGREGSAENLSLTSTGIFAFTDAAGQFMLAALIENTGDAPLTVDVAFYDDEIGDTPIETTTVTAAPHDQTAAVIPWTPAEGAHYIQALLDPDNRITESNELDNMASRQINRQGTELTHGQLKTDRMDRPFIPDPDLIGPWVAIDHVDTIESFDESRRKWRGEFAVPEIQIAPDGRIDGLDWTWTQDYLMRPERQTASRYWIRDINGTPTLFFEWKDDNYTIRHQPPTYYVMRRPSTPIDPD